MSGINKYEKYIMEAAFKTAVKDKPSTSPLLAWYEEPGNIAKRVDLTSLWIDSQYIPEEAPETIDNIFSVKVGTVTVEVLEFCENVTLNSLTGTHASFYHEKLKDIIEPSFGTGYQVVLKDYYGEIIPFGLKKWVVDPNAGVLSFMEGFPEGYELPLSLSFYRYIGKKGPNGLLTSDGRTNMDDDYTPIDDKAIATKKYVDTNISETDSTIKKLIPDTPPTFEGVDLKVLTNLDRYGALVNATDPFVPVIYTNEKLIVDVPAFYKDNIGVISFIINDTTVQSTKIQDLKIGTLGIFEVQDIFDPYGDDIVANDFYESVKLQVVVPYSTIVGRYSEAEPYLNVKIRYSTNYINFTSNTLKVGITDSYINAIFSNNKVTMNNPHNKHISGVPALDGKDVINHSINIVTMHAFRPEVVANDTIDDLDTRVVLSDKLYNVQLPGECPIHTLNEQYDVPADFHTETLTFRTTAFSLDGENGTYEKTYNIRIDSLSDESTRCKSPDETWQNYGREWDQSLASQSLLSTNELQMLAGKYQWPRGDYSQNGVIPNNEFPSQWPIGPNYESITSGERFVTFKLEMPLSNGFYVEFVEPEGLLSDTFTHSITNFSTFKCKVEGKTDWLDMKVPYDGVLNPAEIGGGCLSSGRSTKDKKYFTFGNVPISGTLYVVIGINYDLNIKFKSMLVSPNS